MPNRTPMGEGAANNTSEHHDTHRMSGSAAANVSGIVINATMTAHTSTGQDDGGAGVPGGVIALVLCLVLVGVAGLCIVFYLKKTGKLYKMIPFKPLINPRRSSFSSSDRALHVQTDHPLDHEEEEAETGVAADPSGHRPLQRLTVNPGAGMFTIEDHDMDNVDIDATSRGTNEDNEYFYDEVFGNSVFEDEATNASMRQLYLASDEAEEDMLDVDAFVDSITGNKSPPQAKKTLKKTP
ncbi:hypothetical protein ACOMHN_015436 [Nucella lapillus]